jgi:glycine C-acetyltransferase
MEPNAISQKNEDASFELFRKTKIDAKKHTLYETLIDPRLDNLDFDERFTIFNGWQEDMALKRIAHHQRQGLNGCGVERTIFDPTTGNTKRMINFASNDYLNMTQHPSVINAGIKALQHYGAGAGAACNASGQTKIKSNLEKEISETFETERTLVFNSGYTTNIGVLTALLRSNDVAIVDMYAHSSIMDGVENRNKMLFKHNDMASLESVLRRADRQYANKIVIVDGVYSMDGDIANIPEISALCKKYNALLMVDEAHAFGVIGKNGLGILDHFNMPSETIDILVGTLSKAIGSSGGFVTGKKKIINYLEFASRTYLCTTAPFIASNATALEAIRIIKQDTERRKNLWKNINYFKLKLKQLSLNIGKTESGIFPIILADHNKVLEVTTIMGNNGVQACGIPYPLVPRKLARIRMTVTSEMTLDQLNKGYTELYNAIDTYDNSLTGSVVNDDAIQYQQTISKEKQQLISEERQSVLISKKEHTQTVKVERR